MSEPNDVLAPMGRQSSLEHPLTTEKLLNVYLWARAERNELAAVLREYEGRGIYGEVVDEARRRIAAIRAVRRP